MENLQQRKIDILSYGRLGLKLVSRIKSISYDLFNVVQCPEGLFVFPCPLALYLCKTTFCSIVCPRLMQQEIRLLKFGWILLLATGVGILAFGLIVAAYPPVFSDYSEGLLRAVGVATTGMGIFGVMITLKAYRRGEKWAWFTLWYYPIFWTMHLTWGLPPGIDHIHQIIFIVLSLLGLLLPVRQFFSRNMVRSRRQTSVSY
jgi:hypothetical protein